MTRYGILALDSGIDTTKFHCGNRALDEYIRRYAAQDVRRSVARVFVATPENEPHRLAGFFALSAGSVSCSDMPESLAKKLPRYPVPVALIGRLAVGDDFQGKGRPVTAGKVPWLVMRNVQPSGVPGGTRARGGISLSHGAPRSTTKGEVR